MITTILIAAAIFVLAAASQAVTGFGSAMVAVPLLALTVSPVAGVVAVTLVSVGMTAYAAYVDRRHIALSAARTFVLTGIVGLPVGLVALRVLSERRLTLLVALVLLALVALIGTGVTLPSGRGAQRLAGLLSGALLTSTGMNGPPLVVVLQAMRVPRISFRATLQAVFLVEDVLAVAGFGLSGAFSVSALLLTAGGVVGMPIGWWLGNRVFHRLSPVVFRRLVLLFLTATAVTAIIKAL